MTLRLQITTALAVLAAVAAIIAAVASYTSVEQRLTSETDQFLNERLEQILLFNKGIRDLDTDRFGVIPRGEARSDSGLAPFVRFDVEIAYLASDGSTIFAISETRIPAKPTELLQAQEPGAVVSSRVEVEDRTYETLLASTEEPDQEPVIIQLARDITEQEQTLTDLRVRLAVLVAAVVAAAAAVGALLASRLVRPLDRLRAATREVAENKDFSRPLEVRGPGEVSEVTSDFNSMLRELDQSLQQQHQLVQDAGHELRTPLTTIRASIELMQRMGPEHQVDREELLATATVELGELTRLVDELVSLAASPFDETPVESIDLAVLVADTVEAFTAKNPGRNFDIKVGKNAVVAGKRSHLRRALANVVTNADKFAPPNTPIHIEVDQNTIKVHDHGPGIPVEDLPHVFDKFFRSTTVQSISGSGLGLALVDEIVKGHDGSVTAANHEAGGAIITVHLPPG